VEALTLLVSLQIGAAVLDKNISASNKAKDVPIMCSRKSSVRESIAHIQGNRYGTCMTKGWE
jgi:hypothetical protein